MPSSRRPTSRPLLAIAGLLLLAGCQLPVAGGMPDVPPAGITARDRARVPSYRLILGSRLPATERPVFLAALASSWLPAMRTLQVPGGLDAYVSAAPPAQDGLPDEVALAAYASEEAYQRVWSTPAGRLAAGLGSGLYAGATGLGTRVVPLPAELVDRTACDVLQAPTDWQGGFTTFFIGKRQDHLPAADFLRRLHGQVLRERAAFVPQGLAGYVFMATADYKLSFMHWPDMATFGRAMASVEGQAVAAESRQLMRTVQFAGAIPFGGSLEPGRVVTLGSQAP